MSSLIRSRKSRFAAILATGVVSLGFVAGPASAAGNQNGLVNVALEDVTVQVPVSVAANLCGIPVNVLAVALSRDGTVTCENGSTATANRGNSNR